MLQGGRNVRENVMQSPGIYRGDDQEVTLRGLGIDLFAVYKCLSIPLCSGCSFVELRRGAG